MFERLPSNTDTTEMNDILLAPAAGVGLTVGLVSPDGSQFRGVQAYTQPPEKPDETKNVMTARELRTRRTPQSQNPQFDAEWAKYLQQIKEKDQFYAYRRHDRKGVKRDPHKFEGISHLVEGNGKSDTASKDQRKFRTRGGDVRGNARALRDFNIAPTGDTGIVRLKREVFEGPNHADGNRRPAKAGKGDAAGSSSDESTNADKEEVTMNEVTAHAADGSIDGSTNAGKEKVTMNELTDPAADGSIDGSEMADNEQVTTNKATGDVAGSSSDESVCSDESVSTLNRRKPVGLVGSTPGLTRSTFRDEASVVPLPVVDAPRHGRRRLKKCPMIRYGIKECPMKERCWYLHPSPVIEDEDRKR